MALIPELRFEVYGAKLEASCLPSSSADSKLELKAELGDQRELVGCVPCTSEPTWNSSNTIKVHPNSAAESATDLVLTLGVDDAALGCVHLPMDYLKEKDNINVYVDGWFKLRTDGMESAGQIHIKMVYAESSDTIITEKKGSAEGLLTAAGKMAPSQLAPLFEKLGPIVQQLGTYADQLSPKVQQAMEKWDEFYLKIEPYEPQDLVPAAYGLALAFVGGQFSTTLGAVEAFQMVGSEGFESAIAEIRQSYEMAKHDYLEDEAKDDDGDGIPDVLQISSKDLLTRKMMVVMRAADPDKITKALGEIANGLMAVIAALQIKSAKAITLGNAVSEILQPPALRILVPPLKQNIPQEYHRWVEPGVTYVCKSAAVSLAWSLFRYISAFHSALRGGQIFSVAILKYLAKRKVIADRDLDETQLDENIGMAVAFLGLYMQLKFGFSLPFPLNVILAPLSLAEWFLTMVVGVSAKKDMGPIPVKA